MARLKALLAGGFSLSSGFGDKQQTFRVSTLNGEVYIPDEVLAKEKAKVDSLISSGTAAYVTDTTRQGPRLVSISPALLYSAATPVPFTLPGEPVQKVVIALGISGAGAVAVYVEQDLTLATPVVGDYSVTNGEVTWTGATDASALSAVLFFVE